MRFFARDFLVRHALLAQCAISSSNAFSADASSLFFAGMITNSNDPGRR
jgi:hypothetical protein